MLYACLASVVVIVIAVLQFVSYNFFTTSSSEIPWLPWQSALPSVAVAIVPVD
jgi:hypothetical protein